MCEESNNDRTNVSFFVGEAFTSIDLKLFHQQMDDLSLSSLIVLFPSGRNRGGTKEDLTAR